MPRTKVLSPEQEHEICQVYQSGVKTVELSRQYNCSMATIRNTLRAYDIPIRQERVLSEDGRKRLSEAAKRQWANGKAPPMLGKKHSAKAKARMSKARIGPKNPRWKGGRKKVTKKSGEYYIYLLAPDHPTAQGKTRKYVAEHRLVMEQHLGRYLLPHEKVHHRNGVKHDNRLENLKLVLHSNHDGKIICPHCLQEFYIK